MATECLVCFFKSFAWRSMRLKYPSFYCVIIKSIWVVKSWFAIFVTGTIALHELYQNFAGAVLEWEILIMSSTHYILSSCYAELYIIFMFSATLFMKRGLLFRTLEECRIHQECITNNQAFRHPTPACQASAPRYWAWAMPASRWASISRNHRRSTAAWSWIRPTRTRQPNWTSQHPILNLLRFPLPSRPCRCNSNRRSRCHSSRSNRPINSSSLTRRHRLGRSTLPPYVASARKSFRKSS